MLNLSFNLYKVRGGYNLTLTADENGTVVHEDVLDKITTKAMANSAAIIRMKAVQIGEGGLTFGLNILDQSKMKLKHASPEARKSRGALKK